MIYQSTCVTDMKQLLTEEELVGKTIAAIVTAGDGDMWIRFTDNSFTVLDYSEKSNKFGDTWEAVVVSEYDVSISSKELYLLGFFTKEEYLKIIEEEKRKHETRLTEHQERLLKEKEEEELRQYRLLHQKFGHLNL